MGKVWAIDAIALFSQQNWIPLTVFHAGFEEIIFLKWRNVSNSIGSFSSRYYVGKCENQLSGHELCMFTVAEWVYLNLKLSDVISDKLIRGKTPQLPIIALGHIQLVIKEDTAVHSSWKTK